MTTIQNKTVSSIDHLSAADIESLGRDLDAIRQQVLDTRGERDAAYIRRVITAQRTLEASSRIVLLFSLFPPAWLARTTGLSVAQLLANMAGRKIAPRRGSGTTRRRPTRGSTPTTKSTTPTRT